MENSTENAQALMKYAFVSVLKKEIYSISKDNKFAEMYYSALNSVQEKSKIDNKNLLNDYILKIEQSEDTLPLINKIKDHLIKSYKDEIFIYKLIFKLQLLLVFIIIIFGFSWSLLLQCVFILGSAIIFSLFIMRLQAKPLIKTLREFSSKSV